MSEPEAADAGRRFRLTRIAASPAGTALLGLGLGYAASVLGYLLTIRPSGVVFLWPPSGLVPAALLLSKRSRWTWWVLGSFVGNALADSGQGAAPALALVGSAVNSAEQLGVAALLTYFGCRQMTLTSLRELSALVVGAVLGVCGLSSLLGATVLQAAFTIPYATAWLNWFTGDALGVLILLPLVTTWAHAWSSRELQRSRRIVEAVILLLAIAAVTNALLSAALAPANLAMPYLAFPLLLWAGIRLGPIGATTAVFVMVATVAVAAVSGSALFGVAGASARDQVFGLYSYLALGCVSAFAPAVVFAKRVQSEARLRESEARFRLIADNVNEAFFVADTVGRSILYVNPSWATIWGRPLTDGLSPRTWLEAIHPDDQPSLASTMARIARGEPTDSLFRVRRPDGTVRWVRGRAFPVRDATGSVYRAVGLVADVTELRELEHRATQSQKIEAVGLLAGGVAHDFNNLLTVVFCELDDVLASSALAPEHREALAAVRKAAESAAALTRQLLAFSRRQPVAPTVFDANRAVADVAKMLRRLIGEDVELVLQLAPGSLAVHADPGQFEQVLTNLAVNARDAMPEGGVLTVGTAYAAEVPPGAGGELPPGADARGWVVIAVRDQGTGVSDEALPHLFEPFFTTKEHGRGTGLGLATCLSIVAQARGAIRVDTAVGKGTTVSVYLPHAAGQVVAAAVAAPASVSGGNETILLVEDQPDVRAASARTLRALGYEVLEARDADEALKQLAKSPAVALLLTDVVLPTMNGPELAELVQAGRPTVKTLFMSGYADSAMPGGDLADWVRRVVPKPFTAETLGRRVRDALDRDPEA